MTPVHNPSPPPADRLSQIRARLPANGLFADHEWRIAPEPFPLDAATYRQIETLGRVLLQFYRAANLLYRQSLEDRQPAWVADWLERGKPANLIELQRAKTLRNELPRVIRPDLLLVDQGLKLTELDSVPGGIGLTGWLNQTYHSLGMDIVGGPDGMIDGFVSLFDNAPTIHIIVSEESKTYRPEMVWLAERLKRLGQAVEVRDTSPFQPTTGAGVYRFFELFDLDNIPAAEPLFQAALNKQIQLTPPPKSFLEEKLLLGLLWNRQLETFWLQELGRAFFATLRDLVPRTWILDPSPLPPHGVIPELNLSRFEELKSLSQKQRNLILKISGYSAEAWGARGVYLGSDLSAADWSTAVDRALHEAHAHPYILQTYEKPRQVPLRYYAADVHEPRQETGRARLCPYYFVSGSHPQTRCTLGGVLATICPADKKILHGMRDAALAPCAPPPGPTSTKPAHGL